MPSAPPQPVIATISRLESFSCAHRLHSNALSAHENLAIFDKCNNIHGHNYTLQVDLRGPINPKTGMILNLVDLKECIHTCILSVLDHRNLDADVAYFNNGDVPSTTENLAVFIFRTLRNALPKFVGIGLGDGISKPKLLKVILWETDKNKVEYYED